MDEATLCHPIVENELLLIRKQRGLGAGKLVGPGGTVESDETPRECVIREVREELRIGVEPERVGAFTFAFGAGIEMLVHVYRAEAVDGVPTATPEAEPVWVDVDAIPYEEMWVDDRHWLPLLLAGESFSGHFAFDADGDELLDWWVRPGDDPGAFAAAVRENPAERHASGAPHSSGGDT